MTVDGDPASGSGLDAGLGLVRLGVRPYADMVEAQEALVEARQEGRIGDLLLMLEHPPTYTRGRRSEPGDLLDRPETYRARGIEVRDTPRGGKVTYHGPGQLVMYPILDLKGLGTQPAGADRADVAGFVASLERAMTAALAESGISAGAIQGLTGLWVSREGPVPPGADAATMAPEVARGSTRKIGSIGLKISRGVTSHGLSLNVSCDLAPFDGIVSCGIEQCQVSSVALESDPGATVEQVGVSVAEALADDLGLRLFELDPALVGLDTPISATP